MFTFPVGSKNQLLLQTFSRVLGKSRVCPCLTYYKEWNFSSSLSQRPRYRTNSGNCNFELSPKACVQISAVEMMPSLLRQKQSDAYGFSGQSDASLLLKLQGDAICLLWFYKTGTKFPCHTNESILLWLIFPLLLTPHQFSPPLFYEVIFEMQALPGWWYID